MGTRSAIRLSAQLCGTVTKWDEPLRMGWIKCDNGEEVCVPSSSLPAGQKVQEGHTVHFDLDADIAAGSGGHPAAANISGPGLVAGPRGPETGLTGVVRDWNGQFGYINRGKELIFCNVKGITCGGSLVPGKTVTFDVEDSGHRSGRRAAKNVQGEGVRERGKMAGWVKSWNFERGYGFIQSATGDLVFCHMSAIGDGWLAEQRPVTFDAVPDSDRGRADRLRAYNVDGPGLMSGRKLPPEWAHVAGYGGGEKRKDPNDGKRYTKQQFYESYGGYREWDGAEERVSPLDGKTYTKDQFVFYFGGLAEWHQGTPTAAASGPPAGGARPPGGGGGMGGGMGGGGVTPMAGDWICPGAGCGFNNFASRSHCMKCSTTRP
eukprot:TRINITY_DN8360_c0_g1_i1.p1 TRINITY_DN8360_c0_g1~~TRINITY_DN8360_c0_g1_i1.p1  ORF type:complete len:376 (+),score=108.14 TRINITY_DN8360_c0_g1_i1:78-1205(+)